MPATRTERALDRRGFLFRAIQLAAATQLLSACGGGSDQDDTSVVPPAGATTLAGQVVLPAGLSLAGTRVSHLLGDAGVSATGAFQVPFIEGAFAFSQVRDAAGNLLVFGFLRAEQPTLSVRSTAEALMYRGLGLWAHAPRIRVAALALLRTEDLASVETAIAAAIATGGPAWASSAMPDVGAAVKAKVAALIGTPPAAAATRKQALGMIVTPTERVSGLIVEGDGIGACTVTNDFRRRSLLAWTETTAKLESGTEYPLPENMLKKEMKPTEGLSSPLQALFDLWYERKSYYTPVTETLATPRFPDTAVYTRYKIYAMGPGSALGQWNDLPDALKIDGLALIFSSVLLDFVVPLLASVVIFAKAEDIDEFAGLAETSDVLKDVILGLAKVPELVALLLNGDFTGCCEATVRYIRGTDSVQILFDAALAAICETLLGPFAALDPKTGKPVTFTDFIKGGWARLDKFLDTGEFALTLFDSAVQALDIASSSMAETWDITVTKAKVTLNPAQFFVEKNGLFSGITAVSVDATQVEGKVFGYSWKCGQGHLSAGDKYGPTIDSTTLDSVGYDAVDVAPGTVDQIDVSVFLSGLGSDDPVGSAKAKVYVTGLTLTPASRKLAAGETVALAAQVVGMRPLAAGETIVYRWSMTGSGGALTAGQTATASYRADATQQGVGTIAVEAFLGEQRIGRAETKLSVGNLVVVSGRVFEDHWKDASGCHTGMYIAFPKVKDAMTYDVHVSGMRGPVFGTEYHWFVGVDAMGAVSPFPWTDQGSEILGGSPRGYAILGGGNGGGDECVSEADGRFAAWYAGSTVEVTAAVSS